MLDRKFCEQLEYKICETFKRLDNENTKDFWCDGVLQSESENFYSLKFIKDKRKVTLKAYVGNNGQDEYELILFFGSNSLSRISKELDFIDTFPNSDLDTKFYIDTEQRQIKIQFE